MRKNVEKIKTEALVVSLRADLQNHQGNLPNLFSLTLQNINLMKKHYSFVNLPWILYIENEAEPLIDYQALENGAARL